MTTAADSYRGVFEGRLAFGARPALLLVDMVAAYLEPSSPLYAGPGAQAAVESAARLAGAAREAGAPVVLTGVRYRADGSDGGVFFRKAPVLRVFVEGSPLGTFAPELTPRQSDLVLVKQMPSAFFGTGLAERLRALEVDTVVLGGFSTSGCVRASALDAMQYGFAPFVVREACADRHPDPHASALFDLQAKYAEVVDEAFVAERLRR